MGWFLKAARSASADPRYSVVSVLGAAGTSVGGGVLLAPDQLLTCAHVVNDALGRAPFDTRHPVGRSIPVALHGPSGTARHTTRVSYWVPARRRDGVPGVRENRDHEWLGDLAVLQLEAMPARPVPLPEWQPMEPGQSLRAWHGTGLSSSFADVRVKTCDGVIAYMDGDATGMAIAPAYSGGPLWAVSRNAVVGIVAAHIMPPTHPTTGLPEPFHSQNVARRSWGIPWQRIENELRAVGAAALFDLPEPDPEDPALPLLTDLLDRCMPSPSLRGDHARAVAERCGYGYADQETAPTTEEFARLLLTEPRALATLVEVLQRRDPAAVPELLAAGRLSEIPKLLSPREHRRLMHLLGLLPAPIKARLTEAVRAALPLAAAFPGDDSPEALLDHLECLPGDSRTEADGLRVPGLLRVIEYVAVLCTPAQRADLRLWCNSVVDRLGIPRPSLAERRSDAEDWARAQRRRTAPSRVLARITRAAADRYRLRMWCDEGEGPRQASTDGDTTYSGAEAAGELLRVLQALYRAAPDGRRPLLEAHVDREGLNLPIDEWNSSAPDDLVPGVLGAEYPLVVICPELLYRYERFLPDWRHRWRHLDTDASLYFGDAAQGRVEVYGALLENKDAVRVFVDVPPRTRDEIVQTCLMMGVPVVVWDRGRQPRSHAVERMTAVTARELPEGVRAYRAKTINRPQEYTGHPVLAWADADRAVPRLQLSEPWESI
ncbi:trypsin-like peptidase domain-containing protein [Streptomyces tailanensis]|uniref:VMAP-C domain-containing protein n=1 Tax=Streptomyces tailanensis TaxID=2569858 RepID=UPI00122E0570|nr:trypsin-like peptidase domain-containing protein [Streptomyces tailanensis]